MFNLWRKIKNKFQSEYQFFLNTDIFHPLFAKTRKNIELQHYLQDLNCIKSHVHSPLDFYCYTLPE